MNELKYETVHITNGGSVHLCTTKLEGYKSTYPNCGTGQVSAGIKRRSHFRITKQPVTCKKCLKIMLDKNIEQE